MKIKLTHQLGITIVFVAAILLSSCSDEYKDLGQYIKNLKQSDEKKQKKYTLADVIKTPSKASYHASKLRAPFANPELQAGAKKDAMDPLQSYPVSMLRFVGTIARNKKVHAYIQAPDSMIYEVKEGDIIGDHYGKVISIEPKLLNIKEEELDHGKPIQRIITIQLKDDS